MKKRKKGVRFRPVPKWFRIVGIASAVMYVLFIGAYVFGDYKYVIIEFLFLAGSPIYVSWISNLLVAWAFEKQRKLTGFLFVELLSLILFGALILVLWMIQGSEGNLIQIMVGLFTVTLVANMIIYPLVTFPRQLQAGEMKVVGRGDLVEY